MKAVAPPGDRVAGKTRNPDREGNQIAEGQQPQSFHGVLVLQNGAAHNQTQNAPQKQHRGEQEPGPGCGAGKNDWEEPPGTPKGRAQADVPAASSVSNPTRPSQLMAQEPA